MGFTYKPHTHVYMYGYRAEISVCIGCEGLCVYRLEILVCVLGLGVRVSSHSLDAV